MSFVPGIIIPWVGTNASIPSGWVRETDLDGKYPKGQGTQSPGTTGGNANHTHTSPVHSHTLNAHAHDVVLSTTGTWSDVQTGGTGGMVNDHNHGTSSIDGTSGGTTATTAATYGSVSNDPPYYGVIFIRCTTYTPFLPEDASILWDNASIPDGLGYHNGVDASPDLRNKYLKGAATGLDSGATGGSYTNVHDLTHTHSVNGHTHSGNTNSTSNPERDMSASAGTGMSQHNHAITLASNTQPIDTYTSSLTTSETVEPAYRKLLICKNTSGDGLLAEVGMIAMWKGALADVPVGWSLYTQQNDKYLKIANSVGEIASTGGSNTHTHGSQSHSHTSPSGHTHSGDTVSAHDANRFPNGGAPTESPSNPTTNHSFTSVSTTNATYASATTTADSSNNEPPYNTMAYIKLDFIAGGAMFLLL